MDAALLGRIAAALAPRAEILEGYVFGSRARGAAQPHRDVDSAVYVSESARLGSAYG